MLIYANFSQLINKVTFYFTVSTEGVGGWPFCSQVDPDDLVVHSWGENVNIGRANFDETDGNLRV